MNRLIASLFACMAFVLLSNGPIRAGGAEYIWLHQGKEAGTLQLEAVLEDGAETLNYHSALKLDMGVAVEQSEAWQVVYREGALAACLLRNSVNGRLRSEVSESSADATRTVNGKAGGLDRGPVGFSYVKLFFAEPAGVDRLYSELHGDWFSVRKSGEDTYEVTDHRNRKHRFVYGESGQLLRAEVPATSGELVLLPVSE